MKTILLTAVVIIFAATQLLYAQRATNRSETNIHNLNHRNGRSISIAGKTKNNFLYDVQIATGRRQSISGKQVGPTRSILSGGWLKDTYFSKAWVKGAWVNHEQLFDSYDAFGNHTGSLAQDWNDTTSTWKSVSMEHWEYDSLGNSVYYLDSTWNGSSYGVLRTFSTYDTNGYETGAILQSLVGGVWVNTQSDSISYDTNQHPTSDWQKTWTANGWGNSIRYSATYDSNGNRKTFLMQYWNSNDWANNLLWSYSYDANWNQILILKEAWISNDWANASRDINSYDGQGNITTDMGQVWNGATWINSQMDIYTNDSNGNNTDILEQVWKSGGWNNSLLVHWTWMKASGLAVSSPVQGETVLAGTPYNIEWRAPGYDKLNIDLSLDSGVTYNKIARNVPSSPEKYTWRVADTLSAKCRIRISNASDSTDFVKTGQFKIKGYFLTRYKPNGDYESFDPAVHGWSYRNTDSMMWPPQWYQRFYYPTDIDPNTGARYPNFHYHGIFKTINGVVFPDWPLFVRAFGYDVCYLPSANPSLGPYLTYSFRAVQYWGNIISLYNGSCFGFAVSSLLAFDFPTAFQNYFPALGTLTDLHDYALSDSTRIVINQLFLYQFGVADLLYDRQVIHTSPRQTLQDLKSMLMSEIRNDRPIVFRNKNKKRPGAHELVPYKLVREGSTATFDVYMYDSNCPGGDCGNGKPKPIAILDSAANSWSYPPLGWSSGDSVNSMQGVYLDAPANTYLNRPMLPGQHFVGGGAVASKHRETMVTGAYLRVFNTPNASITISDSLGNSIGYADSAEFNTLPDGFSIIPATSQNQAPIGYFIPNGTYSATLHSFLDTVASLTVFDSLHLFGYWRGDAVQSQSDRLSFHDGISVGNPDAQSKLINLDAVVTASDGERTFLILNCPLSHNDSLQLSVPDTTGLKIVNRGVQTSFDLNLILGGSDHSGLFTHAGIIVPAQTTGYIDPDWNDLTAPVKILEDVGNTGTINDSIFVSNQTTGVKSSPKRGLPVEFSLDQNYPNPFNPATVIRYSLPKTSKVTLRVFNILGQTVATLVSGTEQPGYKSVEFNAANLPSGLYFYRLTAGDFTTTRKMMLLR